MSIESDHTDTTNQKAILLQTEVVHTLSAKQTRVANKLDK